MSLSVPQRRVADTQSFPVDPTEVAHWLAGLHPMRSLAHAREVYRGLKHSNRLHNDIDRRRSVLACFVPVLRTLHNALFDNCRAQPLPLTAEFLRDARLLDGLLREEAFAFKILVAESARPASDDVRRAMQALARQAEVVVNGYRKLPAGLLRDAHQLYDLAEQAGLLHVRSAPDLSDTSTHYRHILLLGLFDIHQQRVLQVPVLLPHLLEQVATLEVSAQRPDRPLKTTDLAIHLDHGAAPCPASALLFDDAARVRWIDTAPLLTRLDERIAQTRRQALNRLGAVTLERQSLARVRLAIPRTRHRRASRVIGHQQTRVVFGHQSICSMLHYQHRQPDLDEQDSLSFTILNESPQGASLYREDCPPGTVQVGDLVMMNPTEGTTVPTAINPGALVGVVRWLIAEHPAGLSLGVEFLARGLLPVTIRRTTRADQPGTDDFALIVACRVRHTVLQTMLLPPFRYQQGDRLTASQDGKSRRLKLRQCLQSNGLFSHHVIADGNLPDEPTDGDPAPDHAVALPAARR